MSFKSSYDGYTALIWASRNGHTKIAQKLVDNGANVNEATKFDKYTSLIDASLAGNFKIVQILIEKGANVNATTKVRYSKNWLKVANLERYFQFQKMFLKFSFGPKVERIVFLCFKFGIHLSHVSTKVQNVHSGPKVVNLINTKVERLRNRVICNLLELGPIENTL